MPGLLIKDFPPELHRRLKQEAARHHRSMTRQPLALLEQAQDVRATYQRREVLTLAQCRALLGHADRSISEATEIELTKAWGNEGSRSCRFKGRREGGPEPF